MTIHIAAAFGHWLHLKAEDLCACICVNTFSYYHVNVRAHGYTSLLGMCLAGGWLASMHTAFRRVLVVTGADRRSARHAWRAGQLWQAVHGC